MSADGTHPDIPDKGWTNPFPDQHPLHDLFGRRVRNEADLVIIVDDYHSRRGTGKTIASLQLAEGMDQNGGLTKENVTLRPEELRNAYANLPKRSALVLDEGELGADKYQASSKTNRALREIMSIGRVEQKYVIINTPDMGFIDSEIRQMADVWMTMLRKGLGLIHWLKRQRYARGGGKILTEVNGLIEFDDVQTGTRLRDIYNYLNEQKQLHIDGEESNSFVPESEHEQALKEAREEARQEMRNELLTAVYEHPEHQESDTVSYRTLGECIGLTSQQVGNIVRANE